MIKGSPASDSLSEARAMDELSGRENQVVLLAADGLTDKEIAKRLDLQLDPP